LVSSSSHDFPLSRIVGDVAPPPFFLDFSFLDPPNPPSDRQEALIPLSQAVCNLACFPHQECFPSFRSVKSVFFYSPLLVSHENPFLSFAPVIVFSLSIPVSRKAPSAAGRRSSLLSHLFRFQVGPVFLFHPLDCFPSLSLEVLVFSKDQWMGK